MFKYSYLFSYLFILVLFRYFYIFVKMSEKNRQMSNELLTEFIDLYKTLPCLWKVKSAAFRSWYSFPHICTLFSFSKRISNTLLDILR